MRDSQHVTIEDQVRAAIRARRCAPAPAECKSKRTRAGLSQRELAVILKVSPGTISLWETGRRRPTGKRLTDYIAALDAMSDTR